MVVQVHVPLYNPSSVLQLVVCFAQPKVHKARLLTRAVRSMLTQVNMPPPHPPCPPPSPPSHHTHTHTSCAPWLVHSQVLSGLTADSADTPAPTMQSLVTPVWRKLSGHLPVGLRKVSLPEHSVRLVSVQTPMRLCCLSCQRPNRHLLGYAKQSLNSCKEWGCNILQSMKQMQGCPCR